MKTKLSKRKTFFKANSRKFFERKSENKLKNEKKFMQQQHGFLLCNRLTLRNFECSREFVLGDDADGDDDVSTY
jgi:hypothetical protein